MPKYIIEREIPGAGKLSSKELKEISSQSNSVLKEIGHKIQWRESYVTADKIYCVYISANEELIKQHANSCKFPANKISEIITIIDPATAE